MKKFLLALVLLNSYLLGYADSSINNKKHIDTMLFGDVLDDSGEHIPFSTITVVGTTIGTIADITGHFKLTGVPEGKHTVRISAVGFAASEYDVDFKIGKQNTIRITLMADQIGLEQVVVSGDRNEKSRRDVATIVNSIGPKLMEITQSTTLSEGLNYTPGLRMENDCQNCGFTQVRMNGLEGPYSQILINSRPVFSGLAGVYGLELIPANMIDRIEVVRGGGSALFGGNAIAGTINLITKEPVNNSFAISGTLNALGNGASDNSLNLNASVLSSDYRTGLTLYGFKRSRDEWDANNDGFSELSEIANNTFGASIFHRMGNRSKIGVDYFYINEDRRGGSDFDKVLHEAEVAEAVEHNINSMSATYEQFFRDHDKLSVYAAMQTVNRDSYYGADYDPSAYGNTKDLSYNAGVQYHRDIKRFFGTSSELLLGAETTASSLEDTKKGYYDVETNEHLDNTQIADQQVSTYGAFVQNEWIWSKFRLGLGLRYEHYLVTNAQSDADDISGNVLSPRATALWTISPKFQFRASYANGYRAPQIFDEDLHIETSTARQVTHVNDPNLTQETSNSYTASIDYTDQFGKIITQFLVEGFYTKLNDPFVNEYGEPDEDGNVVYTRKNAEDGAIVKGVNIEANASSGSKLLFQLGLTLQSSEYESAQEFDEKRFFRTPNTYGYFTASYSPISRFTAAVTANYTGEMLVPYFGNTLADPEVGELRTSSAFFDMGAKLSYNFRLGEDLNMQLYTGMKNIFNSFQDDFDSGADRDPGYMYGPLTPRMFYFGIKLGNIL
ncbi:MAG: TonB-dependent receptor [Mangrovibacterium sp.]